MRFVRKLLWSALLVVVLASGLAYFVGVEVFNLDPAQERALRLALLVTVPLECLVDLAALWLFARPVMVAIDAPDELDDRGARRAAWAGHRLAARASAVVLASGCATTLAVVLALWARASLPADVAIAGAGAGTACAILAAMLTYAIATAASAELFERLGDRGEVAVRGTVRGKIVFVGFGLNAICVLLVSATGYVRHRADLEREYLRAGARAVEAAVAGSRGRGAAELVKEVSRAVAAPAVLLSPAGEVLARSGPVTSAAAAAMGSPGAGLARADGGWVITREVPGLGAVRTLLSEEPLWERRAVLWRALAKMTLAVYAATALLAWLAARAITLPIRMLGHAADRIASGDLTASPPTVSRDEMGQLAADFRRMTQGLKGLLRDVHAAGDGVLAGARETGALGERVRRGALDQHAGVRSVQSAVEAMEGSVSLVSRGLGGLSDYVAVTSHAVSDMAAALEEVQRKGGELERAMAAALGDVEDLGAAGRQAEGRLAGLEVLAGRAGGSLAEVRASVAGLERAAEESESTASVVAEGSEGAGLVMEETVHGIEALREAVADAHRRISALGRRSDDVDQVVDFISEVAGRTNLLSLNASIIAAQAGEHGKAFAVVADQIRDLAAQIARSTKSIGDIIHSVRRDVEGTAALIGRGDALAVEGVQLARNSLEALAQVRRSTARGRETAAAIRVAVEAHAQSSREVSALVESVAEGSRAVAAAVQLVGRSVSGVHSVSRGVTAMADRVARALEEQSGLGRRQLENLSRLDRMIGEITRAVENHDAATRRVKEALQALSATAGAHESAVEGLSSVADQMGCRAKALAERVNRFKV
jgi:methyl-accepting chemotaxis protein